MMRIQKAHLDQQDYHFPKLSMKKHDPLQVAAAIIFLAPTLLLADSTTVINEIHYHPANETQTEWIELVNTMSYDMDLGGWTLTGAVEYPFPNDATIAAGRFVVGTMWHVPSDGKVTGSLYQLGGGHR